MATKSVKRTLATTLSTPLLLRRWRSYRQEGYGKKSPEIRSAVRSTCQHNLLGNPRENRILANYGRNAFIPEREKLKEFGTHLAQSVGTVRKSGDLEPLLSFLTKNLRNHEFSIPHNLGVLEAGVGADVMGGSHLFVCAHCARSVGVTDSDDAITTEHNRHVADCCRSQYLYSDHQETYIRVNDAIRVEVLADRNTGESELVTVSRTWADDNCRRVGDRLVDNDLYNYIRRNGDRATQTARWGGLIGGYHSSVGLLNLLPSALFDSREIPLRAGIELEIEVDDDHNTQDAATAVIKLLNKAGEFALAEQDGSLRHGFEVVTRFGGLDVMTEKLAVLASPEFKALVKKFRLRSHDTTTCGLHVTIDRANMSKLHQGKLRVFANAPQNKQLFLSVCRRYLDGGERYARVKPTEFNRISKSGKTSTGDRYEMFNLTKSRVIEFRGPKGTLKYESVVAAIEFARMCWFFTRDTALSQLDTGTFLEYVVQKHLAPETKFLRQYLIEHKLLAAPIPESTSASRRLNLREALFDAITAGHIAVPSEV